MTSGHLGINISPIPSIIYKLRGIEPASDAAFDFFHIQSIIIDKSVIGHWSFICHAPKDDKQGLPVKICQGILAIIFDASVAEATRIRDFQGQKPFSLRRLHHRAHLFVLVSFNGGPSNHGSPLRNLNFGWFPGPPSRKKHHIDPYCGHVSFWTWMNLAGDLGLWIGLQLLNPLLSAAKPFFAAATPLRTARAQCSQGLPRKHISLFGNDKVATCKSTVSFLRWPTPTISK